MNDRVLGTNLARIRAQKGLSQSEVAEKAGISRQAYRSLEVGGSEPRPQTLEAVAAALRVPLHVLLRPVRPLHAVRCRADKKLATQNQVSAEVAAWLDNYHGVEEPSGASKNANLPDCRRRKSPEACAAAARENFELGEGELIRDICGLLEDKGIKVFLPRVASEGFFGLSV